ncbi:MAG TPA: hypothetical protein VFO73_10455 [Candidatus Limnocylindrales bacterium]|nr:hypothetical protein [Candidatus Limnocylindrales bacterium]
MPVFARHLLPVVESRRRPNHRPGGGVPADARPVPVALGAPTFEPASPARSLAVTAMATLRRLRRPSTLPPRWLASTFGRDVELIRTHLAPIRSRAVLAASFGREAFHGDPSGSGEVDSPVAAAYAIRWLELGDGQARPRWEVWLAESAAAPAGRSTR